MSMIHINTIYSNFMTTRIIIIIIIINFNYTNPYVHTVQIIYRRYQ